MQLDGQTWTGILESQDIGGMRRDNYRTPPSPCVWRKHCGKKDHADLFDRGCRLSSKSTLYSGVTARKVDLPPRYDGQSGARESYEEVSDALGANQARAFLGARQEKCDRW